MTGFKVAGLSESGGATFAKPDNIPPTIDPSGDRPAWRGPEAESGAGSAGFGESGDFGSRQNSYEFGYAGIVHRLIPSTETPASWPKN